MNNMYVFIAIFVIAFVTALLRFLPFIIFNDKNKIPKFIQYLGSVLPYSIMAMLVIYCLKDISFMHYTFFLAELISVIVVVIIHVWKRNTILSIIGGTALYMILIRIL